MKTELPTDPAGVESAAFAARSGRLARLGSSLRRERRRVVDGAWLVAGQVATAAATFAGVRLLTEATPTSVYGAVGLLVGILTLGRTLVCFPLCCASQRFFPEAGRRGEVPALRRTIFRILGRSNWLLAGIVLAAGVPLSGGRPSGMLHAALLAALIVLDNLRMMETELFNVARRQRAYTILRTAEAWLRPALALLLIGCLGPTVTAVLLGYLLAEAAVYAGLFALPDGRIGVDEEPGGPAPGSVAEGPPEMAAAVRDFCLPLAPLAIMDWTSSLGDRYLIGGLIGLDAAGIYVGAYGLTSNLFSVLQATVELLMRADYFEAVADGSRRRAREVFARWIVALACLCSLTVLAVTLLRGPIVALLLSERYRGAAGLLPYFAVGHAFWAISMVMEKVFHARQRTKWCLLVRTAGALLSVAVAAPLILAYGMIGAAWAVPIYYGGQLLVCVALARWTV